MSSRRSFADLGAAPNVSITGSRASANPSRVVPGTPPGGDRKGPRRGATRIILPPPEDLDETFGVTRACENTANIVYASHEHCWVTPRIALGSGVWDQDDVDAIVRDGITDVLDCCGDVGHLYRRAPVSYLSWPTPDDGRAQPDDWFLHGVAFVSGALRTPRARAMIYCTAGINRSPAMCYALLRLLGHDAAEAEAMILRARPLASMKYRDDAERAMGWVR